jgi:hypothetical protein
MITAGLDPNCGSFPSACNLVSTPQYTVAREAPHPGSTTTHSSSGTYYKCSEDVVKR